MFPFTHKWQAKYFRGITPPPTPSNHDSSINVIENPIMSFLHPQNIKSVMLLSHTLLNELREYVQGTVQMLIFHCILCLSFRVS